LSGWVPADLLPGLFVALLALALGAALRRWYDPVPPRILALFVLLPFLLFGRALFGGEVLLPLGNLRTFVPFRQLPPSERPTLGLQGDLVHQIAPWQLAVRRALADGRWPLWNGNAGAGMPLLGDPQAQAFQPLVMAGYPFPLWQAVGITAALRVLVALVFFFLLLRRLDLGEPAASLGALAYGLGGFLLLWLGWPVANAAALLPLGLYAAVRADDPGGARDLFLLFLAGAGLLLGGHPETVVYAVAMVGLFLLARALARRSPRPLRRGGLALALAGLAVAPVLLPIREYLPTSHRSVLVDFVLSPRPLAELWEELWQPKTLAFWRERAEQRLLPVAAPRAFGETTFYWGDSNVIEDAGGFAGSATLLLALAALAPVRGRTRFPQERLAAGVLVACLLLVAQPPGLDNLLARLPVVGPTAIHQHHRTLMLVALASAWLAACEAERWRRDEGRRAVLLVLALALAGLIVWGYLAHPHPTIGHLLAGLRASWMTTQLAALSAAAVLLLLPPRRPLAWLLPAVVAAELLVLHLPNNPSSPRRLAYPVTPPIRFLQERLGNDRMMGLGAAVLPANFPLVYGLNDVRIDNPSLPDRYQQVTFLVSRASLTPNFRQPEHRVYDLLGVRWVMTRPGIDLPPPLRPLYRHPTAWIYERPSALPRLFLPVRGHLFSGGSWQAWLNGNPSFAVRALVQSTPRGRHWRARAPKASKLEILSIEPERIRARASLTERRLLASSVFQDGNWHVLDGLDAGERLPAILANGPFVAAWLPPGEREVDLVYRPRSFVIGCLLSALALAAAAAWWVPRPSRSRGSEERVEQRPVPAPQGAADRFDVGAQQIGQRPAAGGSQALEIGEVELLRGLGVAFLERLQDLERHARAVRDLVDRPARQLAQDLQLRPRGRQGVRLGIRRHTLTPAPRRTLPRAYRITVRVRHDAITLQTAALRSVEVSYQGRLRLCATLTEP
jgi:hypothetical protein